VSYFKFDLSSKSNIQYIPSFGIKSRSKNHRLLFLNNTHNASPARNINTPKMDKAMPITLSSSKLKAAGITILKAIARQITNVQLGCLLNHISRLAVISTLKLYTLHTKCQDIGVGNTS